MRACVDARLNVIVIVRFVRIDNLNSARTLPTAVFLGDEHWIGGFTRDFFFYARQVDLVLPDDSVTLVPAGGDAAGSSKRGRK